MNKDFRDAILDFQSEKDIAENDIISKLCNAIVLAAKKAHNVRDGITCEIDPVTYELRVSIHKRVVEDILQYDGDEEEERLITVEEAQAYSAGAVAGDIIAIPLDVEKFGRVSAQTVKHTVRQGIREIEMEKLVKEFNDKKQEIVTAKVININPTSGDATVQIGKAEALLPKKEQIPGERIRVGDMIKIYIIDVKDGKGNEKGPKVMLSRIHTGLVKRLFENEVPEIKDGQVEIRSISREAGSRTKMAVFSKDEDVDPIGACIGPKGARVNEVIKMLGGEKIDIIKYSEDPKEYIGAALAPAEIVNVEITGAEAKCCQVTVPEEQLSLAIGNKGQNARLAAKLTGWKIDIIPFYGTYKDSIPL